MVEINGYNMDMVPRGHMLLIQNADVPGIIGLVGTELANAGINIGGMSISRREIDGEVTALMVVKVDVAPSQDVLDFLSAKPGVLKVAKVQLPSE